jgi:TPP-dependent trihydroxycyclohexane-1,2-dione (THcHDO) dehydratase
MGTGRTSETQLFLYERHAISEQPVEIQQTSSHYSQATKPHLQSLTEQFSLPVTFASNQKSSIDCKSQIRNQF